MASGGKNAVAAGLRPWKSSDFICQGRNCFDASTLAISWDFLIKKDYYIVYCSFKNDYIDY